jgi:hypothetical protein
MDLPRLHRQADILAGGHGAEPPGQAAKVQSGPGVRFIHPATVCNRRANRVKRDTAAASCVRIRSTFEHLPFAKQQRQAFDQKPSSSCSAMGISCRAPTRWAATARAVSLAYWLHDRNPGSVRF